MADRTIGDSAWNEMVAAVRKNSFSEGRVSQMANIASSIDSVSSIQLSVLLQELDFSSERLQALKLFVPKISDPDQFSSAVLDSLYIEKERDEASSLFKDKFNRSAETSLRSVSTLFAPYDSSSLQGLSPGQASVPEGIVAESPMSRRISTMDATFTNHALKMDPDQSHSTLEPSVYFSAYGEPATPTGSEYSLSTSGYLENDGTMKDVGTPINVEDSEYTSFIAESTSSSQSSQRKKQRGSSEKPRRRDSEKRRRRKSGKTPHTHVHIISAEESEESIYDEESTEEGIIDALPESVKLSPTGGEQQAPASSSSTSSIKVATISPSSSSSNVVIPAATIHPSVPVPFPAVPAPFPVIATGLAPLLSVDDVFKKLTLDLVSCPFKEKRLQLIRDFALAHNKLTVGQVTHLLSLLNFSDERLQLLETFILSISDAELESSHLQLENRLMPHFLFYSERQRAKEILAGEIL